MEEFFSIGKAAEITKMTAETLRHYDRIGLVKPEKKDAWTGYRYYSGQDIVRLRTVQALQRMDLSLREIQKVLAYDDLEKIIRFLEQAERKADEKIAELQDSKSKIRLAIADYERKLQRRPMADGVFVRTLPERAILLSKEMKMPTLENLWNYLSHFYNQLEPGRRDAFSFEDLAGIYTDKEQSGLFAVCTRYVPAEGIKILPAGKYLCADCTEKNREETIENLKASAMKRSGKEPLFILQLIVVSGILHWKYQVQVYIGDRG